MEAPTKYPPAPWQLTGSALTCIQCIPVRNIRVPSGLQVVRTSPGKTIGGIYVARYGAGSTLEYSELIVFSALVRAGGRLGGWVSHIFVDSAESVAGGREIWGLPKELAVFEWDTDRVTVRKGETTLVSASFHRNAGSLHIRALLPAFGFRNGQTLHFSARCSVRISRARDQWVFPPESQLTELGLGRGWAIHLSEFNATVPAPEPITVRS